MRFRVALLGLFAFPLPAYAGAWLQEESRGHAIVSASYYFADTFYTNAGHRQGQADYTKLELAPSLEYGAWRDLTIGANLSLQRTHQDGVSSNAGLGDTELFARARLWEAHGFLLSAEPLVKLPSLDDSADRPRIGNKHGELGLGLNGGYTFNADGQSHFADIGAAYRVRLGDSENQLRLTATLGWRVNSDWLVMPQLFITRRTQDNAAAAFTQSSGDDYDLTKLQLSGIYTLSDSTSFQFGWFTDIDGKNTGSGSGALAAVWKRF